MFILSDKKQYVGAQIFRDCESIGFLLPSLEKRGWGRFYYKNNSFSINELLFCKIPLNPPFPKGEAKSRILSQSL